MNIPEATERRWLSYSALKLWRQCQVAWKHQYVDGLRSTGYNGAYAVGSAVHAGTEAHRLGLPLPMALAAGATAMAKYPNGSTKADDCLKAGMLIEAYYERYATERLATVHNEVTVRQHLGGAWWFYGRVDGVVFDLANAGRPQLYECKTTTGPVRDLELTLRQDPQIHLYMGMLRKAFGLECSGAILDIVKKPWSDDKEGGGAVRRRKDEPMADYMGRCRAAMLADSDRYLLRECVEYDEGQVDAALNELRRMAQDVERGDYHSIKGFCCRTPYGNWCEYKELCWYNDASKYATTKEYDGVTNNDNERDSNDHSADKRNDEAAA